MATAAAQSATQSVSGGDDASVFQLIQSHQEKAARLPPVEEIRTLIDRSVRGTLSTFSQKHEGHPSGSMVDFACDADGSPILAISSLAVHTKVDFGDFQFMRIEPKVVRYVSGVATALLGSGEFGSEEYKAAKVDPIAQFSKPVANLKTIASQSHMNRDHADDTKVIVQHSTSIPVDSAYMLDLDSLGFNVKAGYQGDNFKLRIPFPRRAEDRKDVKTLVVEMLQAAKAHDR
ncbi:hypothetical protein C1H46_034026 [Malus baccata]|uniref:DUF2470 domain-containing protein n=1 Tax=Malus baccata TaxID=106549 RepID=A0A540L1S2_MALBA|nr:hypothetical protein C1H46_034026 [Malus baccata]